MNIITSLAIVIGAMAGVATWVCLGTTLGLQVWAVFIGWGSFYHCGGKLTGLQSSVINHIWGAVFAAVSLLVIGAVAGGVLITSVIVGITVILLVMGAHLPILSAISAQVYGFASAAGYALLTGVSLTDPEAVGRAVGITLISLIIGNLFGYVSEAAANALANTGKTA